ncbi:MAG: hypothetical protein CMJ18_02395 [Phycisphaeraceae bacterium]|nr:hypothetical protein [Phycisphaeraceae bacterium]
MLVGHLTPESVSVLPLGTVVLVLAIFTAVIGPGEYFVLGLVRRRRWTWVVFPVTTIAFTLFMMRMSDRAMGMTERRTAGVVYDVADDGSVLRRTRFELLFSGAPRRFVTEQRDGLFTPLDHQGDPARPGLGLADRPPPVVTGAFPRRYEVVQAIAKWTPQVNRITTVGTGDAPFDVDWSALDPFTMSDEEIQRHLVTEQGVDARVLVLSNENLLGPLGEWGIDAKQWAAMDPVMQQQLLQQMQLVMQQQRRGRGTRPYGMRHRGGLDGFLMQISVGSTATWALFARCAPMGGPDLGDLVMHDPSNAFERLVVLVRTEGRNFTACRKLYRKPLPDGSWNPAGASKQGPKRRVPFGGWPQNAPWFR